MSRVLEWAAFAAKVTVHIKTYCIPQYGDTGEDEITNYSAADCVKQAQKYLSRFGRNQRPGEEERDLLKAAHYIGVAATKMEEGKET